MKNLVLYLCDPDTVYLKRLNSFILRQEYSPFVVRTYTGLSEMTESEDRPVWLMVSSVLCNCLSDFIQVIEFRDDRKFCGVIFLDEGNLSERTDIEEVFSGKAAVAVIDKYQSAAHIYQCLLDFCGREGDLLIRSGASRKAETKLVGVYSPDHKRLQNTFAIEKARHTNRDRPRLYITFEESIQDQTQPVGLSPVILALREYFDKRMSGKEIEKSTDARGDHFQKFEMVDIVKSYVNHEELLDILPPASCPYDLSEIQDEEWYFWLLELMEHGGYFLIIVNFGNGIPPLCLMDLCEKIYIPQVDGDKNTGEKLKNMLEFMGKNGISQKVEPVLLEGVQYGLL
ncbi:hypothetical protein [Catenibacillus scindens]|uniref:hypothetical protein n=1 Tax=Catenibacillus scindens TaxID=673271 RepID=UPI0032095B72